MYRKYLLFLIFSFSSILSIYSQKGFRFQERSKIKQRVSFRLINNLIVIPVEINGQELSFILDTGVNKTIIFNLSESDSIGLQNPKKITLRGLGGGAPVAAILSENNQMKVKGLIGYNEAIYVILKDFFDLSSKMGTTIHGIIGYNLLKNFIVKINYKTKKIDFYNAAKYRYKKCRKCEILPIQFYRKKPFVTVAVQLDTIGSKLTAVKMLVDSGGSDAIWFFEHSKPVIKTPKRYFNDILGEGLSGSIFGKRSRIPRLQIGAFRMIEPTVSFLDTLSTQNARKFKNRNGSLGADVLRRFTVWLDYPNRQIMLKKNSSFKNPFNYNMSGLNIIYNGKQLIKEENNTLSKNSYNRNVEGNNTISFVSNYTYKFKPTYKIRRIVKNSVADKAGLKEEDILISINNKSVANLTLSEIVYKLQEKENKKIRITVYRAGTKMAFRFRLEKRI